MVGYPERDVGKKIEEGAEGLFGGDFINRIFTVHLRFV